MTTAAAPAKPITRMRVETPHPYVQEILDRVAAASPPEPEFLQAVSEVFSSLGPVIEQRPEYRRHRILERIVEPERTIQFRVPWTDDAGEIHINRGYRVQFNSALGPYKGGIRFHPTVNLSILKFLGFEQIFKNSLTMQSIGGGKGGSDFDPKGKSDNEIMRFCQTFMTELFRHIDEDTDVPAGDIGVGGREIGYMFGMYKKLTRDFTGVFTGKGVGWGGSQIRTEATGYGLVYFASYMLEHAGESLQEKTCLVSGSGNVAQHTIEKIDQLGGKVVTVSDSDGFIYDPEGISHLKLEWIKKLKNERRGRIREYAEEFKSAKFTPLESPVDQNPIWAIEADCAFPCATQNEIRKKDAKNLVKNGVMLVAEGANMPTDVEGQEVLLDAGVLYGPAKATNAGGVAVSALEMAQNSQRISWDRDEVDHRLRTIMKSIHETCLSAANRFGMSGNYLAGANIAGFMKVADAMIDQGLV